MPMPGNMPMSGTPINGWLEGARKAEGPRAEGEKREAECRAGEEGGSIDLVERPAAPHEAGG